MAHLVKRPTLDFSSGHDLAVHGIEPLIKLCADSVEPAWDSLCPPSTPPLCTRAPSLALKIKKSFKKKNMLFFIILFLRKRQLKWVRGRERGTEDPKWALH